MPYYDLTCRFVSAKTPEEPTEEPTEELTDTPRTERAAESDIGATDIGPYRPRRRRTEWIKTKGPPKIYYYSHRPPQRLYRPF